MKCNVYLFTAFLITLLLALSACGGNDVPSNNVARGSAPFVLPPVSYFEDFIFNHGIRAFNENYVIEIITYEIVSNDNVENMPSVVLLLDVNSESLGRGGFHDFDKIHMLSDGYVFAISSWLSSQGHLQANELNVIRTTRDDPFIVVVLGIDDVHVGTSIFDNDARTVIFTPNL
ncbi:MAG: hypothetical protein FWB87_13700 [Defluviitaleaceae bacterium]|nr:hypothetical protein [Defluviitaleaceae bacterium]